MVDSLAGVALAAGAGTRLRPLSYLRPKPLCPFGDSTLLDVALDSLGMAVPHVAVNVHHGAEEIRSHLESNHRDTGGRRPREIHVSHERDEPLGTAGALVHLRRWLDGRDALVVNADTWHGADLAAFANAWDRASSAVLTTTPGPFGPHSTVVGSLVTAADLARLPPGPCGLWEALWRQQVGSGALVTCHTDAVFHDCGTPRSYLAANLDWAARDDSPAATCIPGNVVGEGAVVQGRIEGCVVWPGAVVGPSEALRHAIRAENTTVLVR